MATDDFLFDPDDSGEGEVQKPGFFGALISSGKRGMSTNVGLITEALPALAYAAVGNEEGARRKLGEYRERLDELARTNPVIIEDFTKIGSVGDAMIYLAEALGENLPSMVPSLGAGAAGMMVGKKLAKDAAEEVIKKYAMRGAAAGAVAGSAAQNIPETFAEVSRETSELRPGVAAVFGGLKAGLDAIPAFRALSVVQKNAVHDVLWKRALKEAGVQFGAEGSTEIGQEILDESAKKFIDSNHEIFSPENLLRFANVGLKAGISGAGVGAGTAALQGNKEEDGGRETQPTPPRPLEDPVLPPKPTEPGGLAWEERIRQAGARNIPEARLVTPDPGPIVPLQVETPASPLEQALQSAGIRRPQEIEVAERTDTARLAAKLEDEFDFAAGDVIRPKDIELAAGVNPPTSRVIFEDMRKSGYIVSNPKGGFMLNPMGKGNIVQRSGLTPNRVTQLIANQINRPQPVQPTLTPAQQTAQAAQQIRPAGVDPDPFRHATSNFIEALPPATPINMAIFQRETGISYPPLAREVMDRWVEAGALQRMDDGTYRKAEHNMRAMPKGRPAPEPTPPQPIPGTPYDPRSPLERREDDLPAADFQRRGYIPNQIYSDIRNVKPSGSPTQQATPSGTVSGSAPTSGTEKGQLGVDMGRLVKMLGSKMYKSGLADINMKELLQNAFDGVKSAQAEGKNGPGKINVRVDPRRRTITISDDGSGMTPETVRKAFLTIGGTFKEGLDPTERSGGFGFAKMAFLFNDGVALETVRNGVKTEFVATGEQLLNGGFDIKTSRTSDPNGTIVTVQIPETMEDDVGNQQKVEFPESSWNYGALNKPLLGNVEVTFERLSDVTADKGRFYKTTLDLGAKQNMRDLKHNTTISFPWGDIEIHYGTKKESYSRHHVLSSGVFQFEPNIPLRPGDWSGIPYGIIMNVKPKVDTTSRQYPFNNQREDWNANLAKDIKAVYGYLRSIAFARETEDVGNTFANMLRMDTWGDAGIAQHLPKPVKRDEIKASKIIGRDGTLFDEKGKDLYKAKDEDVADEQADELARRKNFKIPHSLINDSAPFFHNNLNVDIVEETAKILADENGFYPAGAEQRDAVRNYLQDLGRILVEFKQLFANVPKYKMYATEARPVGLSFDKEYHGVHIRVPFDGFFLNPASVKAKTPIGKAAAFMHTMMHEMAHTHKSGHTESFTSELADIYEQFAEHTQGAHLRLENKLRDLIKSNLHIQDALEGVYNRDSTANASKGLKGDRQSAGAQGEGIGNPGLAPRDPQAVQRGAERDRRSDPIAEEFGAGGNHLSDRARAKLRNVIKEPVKIDTPEEIGKYWQIFGFAKDIANRSVQFRPFERVLDAMRQLQTNILNNAMEKFGPVAQLSAKKQVELTRFAEIMDMGDAEVVETPEGITATATKDGSLVKKGDTIALTGPDLKVYKDMRSGLTNIWNETKKALLHNLGLPQDATSASVEALAATDKKRAKFYRNVAALLEDLETKQRIGYIPHVRVGDWAISVKDAEGNLLWYQHVEKPFLGSLNTKIQKIGRELKTRFPEGDIKAFKPTKDYFKGELRDAVGIIEQFTSVMGTQDPDGSLAEFMDQLKDALNTTDFRRHIALKREGVPGWLNAENKDSYLRQALTLYGTRSSHFIARQRYLNDLRDALTKIKSPSINEYAKRLFDYVRSGEEEMAGARAIAFHWFLGGNISSAALNLTQTLHATWPYARMFANDARVWKEIGSAMRIATKMSSKNLQEGLIDFSKKPKGITDDEWRMLQDLHAQGLVLPVLTRDLQANNFMARLTNNAAIDKGLIKLAQLSSSAFNYTENLNRITAALVGYRLGKLPGAEAKWNKIMANTRHAGTPDNPIAFSPTLLARAMIEDTQGIFAKENRPELLRGWKSVPLQFTSFPLFMLNQWITAFQRYGGDGNILKRAEARKMIAGLAVGLFLTAGTFGMPGVEPMRKLFEAMTKMLTHHNIDLEREFREMVAAAPPTEWLADLFGTSKARIAEYAARGPMRAAGVDISRRTGLEVIPSDLLRGEVNPLGPAGSIVAAPADFFHRWGQGQTTLALAALLPVALKNVVLSHEAHNVGYTSLQGRKLPTGPVAVPESFAQGFGFTPTRVTEARELLGAERSLKEGMKGARESMYDRLAKLRLDAILDGRRGNADGAKQNMEDFRALVREAIAHDRQQKNPSDMYRLDLANVTSRVKADLMALDAKRNMRRTPVALRRETLGLSDVYPAAGDSS
jgi:hypothetical protein